MKEQIARTLLRTLDALPGPLQVRLSGRAPVQIDGQTLAPEQQLILALLARSRRPPLQALTPAQAREMRRSLAVVVGGAPQPVGSVQDLELELPVALRARHYAPRQASGGPREPKPLLVFLHGGGFLYGDLETHDRVCRLLCRQAEVHVLAIDYRLAPEHPFPAAVEDACAAFGWALEHAATLGADPARVGVGGDSAGGNLAAVVAQQAAREAGAAPALQLLIYPVTDFSRHRRSRELFGEGFQLTGADMDCFERHYLGGLDTEQAHDVRASPLLAEELSGLAPAIVVTAGFDPLRDDGEEYAAALRRAGNVVLERRYDSFLHAFISAAGVSRGAHEALVEIAGMMRGVFAMAARAPAAHAP